MESYMENTGTIKAAVEAALTQKGGKRTFRLEVGGATYWVKQPETVRVSVWHTLMGVVSRVLDNNFFRPTLATDPKASLAYEGKRLRELREHGINVPRVIVQEDGYLVLEDAGISLSSLLKRKTLTFDEKQALLVHLSHALAELHNRGFYHSRPALRDFTYKEGKIYFMDFEENPEENLTTQEAIVRDGFLYLHTLFRKVRSPQLIEAALDAYHRSLRPDLWDALVTEARRYRLTYLLLKPLRPLMGKDAEAILETLRYLRQF